MCLIICYQPKSPRDSKENFEQINKTNNDGIGVAYNNEKTGELIVKRGFNSLDEFFDYFTEIPSASSILVHFRKCSVGKVIDENLHPFVVNDNLCFAFNGTISALKLGEEYSDTYHLNEQIIQHLLANDASLYLGWAFKTVLEAYIGSTNKMAFLDYKGRFVIFNPHQGEWNTEKTVWYSNLLWEKTKQEKKKESQQERQEKNKQFKSASSVVQATLALGYTGSYTGGYFSNNLTEEQYEQLLINYPFLGGIKWLKEFRYYRKGDALYREISLQELGALSNHYRCGVKKLQKQLQVIRPLNHVSEDVILEARLKAGIEVSRAAIQEKEKIAKQVIDLTTQEIQVHRADPKPLALPMSVYMKNSLMQKFEDTK